MKKVRKQKTRNPIAKELFEGKYHPKVVEDKRRKMQKKKSRQELEDLRLDMEE